MSRSRKKTPVTGTTTARTEKWYKRMWHRRWRQAVKRAVQRGDELMPHRYQFSDPWDGPKDGKTWWGSEQEYYRDRHPWQTPYRQLIGK